MEFETLWSGKKRFWLRLSLGVSLVVLVLFGTLTWYFSYAKYRNTKSIPLAQGTISYSRADFSMLAVNVKKTEQGKYETQADIPTGNFTLNEGSTYCVVGTDTKHLDYVSFEYDSVAGTVDFKGVKETNTKCYLFFDVVTKTTGEQMLAKLEAQASKKYTTSPMPTISSTDTTSSTGKLYTTQDNYGTSYVFRGNVQDNWVKFANKRWRIIRINGDGTLRLIYQCGTADCKDTTGNNTQINGGTDIAYNAIYNDNTYVGYYNQNGTTSKYPDAHQGKNPSTIAKYINDWYSGTGAMTGYTKYLSGNTGFCNDRQIAQVSRSSYYNTGYGGTSSNATAYAAVDRFLDSSWNWLGTQTPDLRCGVNPQIKAVDKAALQRDLYTTSEETGDGNGILTYPVGLITADEVAMAGGKGGASNSSYYLYTNKYYWTMSPSYFYGSSANVFIVGNNGDFGNDYVSSTDGVRPVINLKANITFSGGNGTSGSPFVVAT